MANNGAHQGKGHTASGNWLQILIWQAVTHPERDNMDELPVHLGGRICGAAVEKLAKIGTVLLPEQEDVLG